MKYEIREECSGVDWQSVADLLISAGMAFHDPEKHRRAFEASYVHVFIYQDGILVGIGRAISDGEYQAAIYDCAVLPEFQGQGLGALIIRHIVERVSGCNIILYASPGKEGFYQKYGFSKMKTGMALFTDSAAKREMGFIE